MVFMVFKFVNILNLHVDFSLEKSSYYILRTERGSQFFCLFNQHSLPEKKWKWHHFQRICNSSELKTTRPAKHVILSLRGWTRYPQEQTGLGFVFVVRQLCVCVSTRVKVPQEGLAYERRKASQYFFMLIEWCDMLCM